MENKKILLVGINARYSHISLGIYSIRAFLEENGISAEICEYTINDSYERTFYDITEKKPDIIGFSTYIWNIKLIERLSADLKIALPETKIIYGGPEAGYSKKTYENADKIISGEGEAEFYKYVTGKEIDFSFPDAPFCYSAPIQKGKTVYYESSRGCPYRCSYCISSLEKTLKFKNLETVRKELMFFIENKVKKVKFIDRTFNLRKDSNEIFKFIIENAKETGFHFEIKPELFDEESFEILKKAPKGLIQFEAGLQSLNEETLEAINRKNDTALIFSNMKKILENKNIHIHIDLIAGLPYEDIKTFIKGFDRVYSLMPDMLQLGFLKVLGGTQIEKEAEKYEIAYSKYPPYQIIKTKWLSVFDIIRLKNAENGLEELSNKGFFPTALPFLFSKNEASPFYIFESFGAFLKDEPPLSHPMLFTKFYQFYKSLNLKSDEEFLTLLKNDFSEKNPNKPLFSLK